MQLSAPPTAKKQAVLEAGTIMLDAQGRVRSYNGAELEAIAQRSEQELVGTHISSLWREDEGGVLESAELLGEAEDHGWIVGHTGEAHPAKFVVRAAQAKDGQLTGFVVTVLKRAPRR